MGVVIDEELQGVLRPHSLVLRLLEKSDYAKGLMTCLEQLTVVGGVSQAEFEDRFELRTRLKDTYFTVVIEDTATQRIVASGTIFVEYKFTRSSGKVGHIEDIVTDKTYRSKQLGRCIVQQLIYIGNQQGCYKIILDCAEHNVPFYEKLGFSKKELQMALYQKESKL